MKEVEDGFTWHFSHYVRHIRELWTTFDNTHPSVSLANLLSISLDDEILQFVEL